MMSLRTEDIALPSDSLAAQLILAKTTHDQGNNEKAKEILTKIANHPDSVSGSPGPEEKKDSPTIYPSKFDAMCRTFAKVILKLDPTELSYLNYLRSDFFHAPSTSIHFNPQGKLYFHTEQESLLLLLNATEGEIEKRLIDCKIQTSNKRPRSIAITIASLPGKKETNFALACSRAALLYDEGRRLAKSQPEKAFNAMHDAAMLGYPEAEIEAAEMFYAGRGVDLDTWEVTAKALKWLRKVATPQDAIDAKFRLGEVLLDPTTIDNDPEEARTWLQAATQAGHSKAAFLLGRMYWEEKADAREPHKALECFAKAEKDPKLQPKVIRLKAAIQDYLGNHYAACHLLEEAANMRCPVAQLLFAWRYITDTGAKADPTIAKKLLASAAEEKGKPINEPAVLVAKALQKIDLSSIPTDKLRNLIRSGNDFINLHTPSSDGAGKRILGCNMIERDRRVVGVNLVDLEVKTDEITHCINQVISPNPDSDPSTQPLGLALKVDLLDRDSGFRNDLPLVLIMPDLPEEKPEETPAPAEGTQQEQRIVIMRSGHHTNNWLAVMGDLDRIMPTLLKYLNRDWKRDISERNSGLEWLPQRLHLSLGKPTFGDVYVGKIGVGTSCWMYVILSTPPPTLRPEIHTVFPVIVAKARKYWLTVKQILEWHNRLEATMICDIAYTTDKECKQIYDDITKSSPAEESKSSTTADSKVSARPVGMDISPKNVTSADESKSPTADSLDSPDTDLSKTAPPVAGMSKLPVFAIDFVARRNIWEGKGHLEVFLSGIAQYMVRNPQESTRLPARKPQGQGWGEDPKSFKGKSLDYTDEDEKKDQTPRSVVPGITGAHGRTYPWSQYKNLRGVVVNEGPRKENRVVYMQGVCQKTIQLPGTIWGKGAYMVTIRIDEERKIDMDIWCLLKHMIDGKATITPGEYMTITAGSVPVAGDLVFADVWLHGTVATGIDPVPTAGTEVTVGGPQPSDSEGGEQHRPAGRGTSFPGSNGSSSGSAPESGGGSGRVRRSEADIVDAVYTTDATTPISKPADTDTPTPKAEAISLSSTAVTPSEGIYSSGQYTLFVKPKAKPKASPESGATIEHRATRAGIAKPGLFPAPPLALNPFNVPVPSVSSSAKPALM